jgi:PAS domain S-box-containing protein
MISVLYVDDERDLLEVARLFLEESGEFHIETSTSAKDALDSPAIRSCDVIIADYQMPGMNGIAFLKEVRDRFGDIPFILFTGRGREEVVIEAINNGADFYLQKGGDPVAQFAELAHKMRQAVKRKQAEHSLHDSERRLSDIIDFLPDATFAIDRSGHVIAWNRAMKEMTGVPAQEMLGKGEYCYAIPFYGKRRPILIDLVFSPHDEVRQSYSFVRADGDILSAETINAAPDGRQCVLSGKAAPLTDSHGSIVGAIESIRDITDLKKTEEELRRGEERYRHLYHYALVGLFETRLSNATIVACNQRYCDLAGFPSVEDAMGRDVLHLYKNPGDRTEVIRILHEQGSITDYEVQFVNHQTGRVFWAQFSAQINREKDVAEGTIIDITERKSLESALEKEQGELKASCDQLTAAKQELRDQFNRLAESERTLRINEERLVMAQGIGHTGSWEYNLATGQIWGSAEGLNIFGFPPVAGNIPIADIEACIMERGRVHQALVDLIAEGREYDLEYLIHPADGSAPRIIHSIARLQRDAGGNPLRVMGVIQDITERKRAEEEIAFKNAILSTQQETSLDGILIVDENAKILNYNRKFTMIWGIPEELLLSRQDDPVLGFIEAQLADPEAFIARVRYLYEHREERSFEELILKDGRILERFSAPMLGETGKYYGRVWYFRDITGRKRAEELLRESERRFHSLYTNMNEGAVLHELVYNEQGIPVDYTILEINPAFEKHLGFFREAVIGKTSREAYGVTEPPYFETYTRVALTGEPAVFETYFPPWNKYFLISAYSPMKGRFATVFDDITERKRGEDALRLANTKLTLITSITRHDITNKIMELQAYRKKLEKELPDPRFREYFQKINAAADGIAAMIRFTKEYETIGITTPAWQDCRSLLDTVARDVPLGNVTMKNGIPPGREVFADPLIARVFYNLLDNAVRYGGKISTIRFYERESNGTYTIVCEDDGNGIPAADKERVFDQGFGKNTGHGLAISREILAISEITITETGDPGRGARFEISVPEGKFRISPSAG